MRNAAPTDVAEASAAITSSAELRQDVSQTLFSCLIKHNTESPQRPRELCFYSCVYLFLAMFKGKMPLVVERGNGKVHVFLVQNRLVCPKLQTLDWTEYSVTLRSM